MSTYSSNLRIELITNGTQAGTWGDTTNNNLAYVLDSSIAGYQTVSVTAASQALTYTSGPTSTASANQAVYAMLQFTTTTGAAFAVYAPPVSKNYIIWNNSGQSMTIYNSTVIGNTTAAGTGTSITSGIAYTVATLSSTTLGQWQAFFSSLSAIPTVGQTITATATGTLAGGATVTATVLIANGSKVMVWSDGTSFYDIKANNITGTLAIANGGTGQITANAALNALLPSQTSNANKYLQTDGTNASWDAISLSTSASASVITGYVYIVATLSSTTLAQWQAFFSGLTAIPSVGQSITATATGAIVGGATVTFTDITGTLPVVNGGTGKSSYSPYAVLYAPTAYTLADDPSVLSFNSTNLSIGTNSSTSVVIGVVYTVASLGSTTLGQWQTLFSALASIPTVAQSITATATGTLAGGATISSANKLTMLGTGSFTNSLVSTSATAADKPTLEFRKTRNTGGGVDSNAIGRLSFYSQSDTSGAVTTESAYIDVTDARVSNISLPRISLVTYSQAVGTNSASLTIGGSQTRLYAQQSIAYESNISHTFTGDVVFNDAVTATTFTGQATSALIRSQTAQATTSGTSFDFTSIPSTAKRITIMFAGVSTNGTSIMQVQVGAGSIATSGYTAACSYTYAGNSIMATSTSAFVLSGSGIGAASALSGSIVFTQLSSLVWVAQGVMINVVSDPSSNASAGTVTLSGALDRVRITTVNGTDTFDAGSINILYE
jgi:hypothetical protein